MLDQLCIRNFVLIHQLELNFSTGLTVLTGETGAGKSILLDAFGLILGDKAQIRFIRPNTSQTTITASFNFPDNAAIILELKTLGIEVNGNLIIRRQITSDGKSKAFINDQPVSVNLLKDIGHNLVDIHGQFDRMLSPSTHLIILDQFCNCAALKGQVRVAYDDYNQARSNLAKLIEAIAYKDSQIDYLKTVLEELDQFDLQESEEETLELQRTQALNRDKYIKAINLAYDHLISEKGIQNQLYSVSQTLQRLPEGAFEIASTIEKLKSIDQQVQDIIGEIDDNRKRLAHSHTDIEQIDDRLHQLKFLARKHHCLPGQLMEKWQSIKTDYEALIKSEENKARLETKLSKAQNIFKDLATQLSAARHAVKDQFATLVENELKPLKLDQVRIKVNITPLDDSKWSSEGMDHIEFLVQTNVGYAFNSIAKVASGGERSRLMLAFKVVLSAYQDTCLLIFDEVDSGVGGAVAAAIGERLSRLSRDQQVISVTHSPQVASYAQHHYMVRKIVNDDLTQADVKLLQMPGQLEEIARMLSGENITDAARSAAQQLLNRANAKPPI